MLKGDNMHLQVDDLYKLQDELDQRIFDLHDTTRAKTKNERLLALLIELGEMINETKCFKFWSVKAPSTKDVILEEYGDGLHFLLSLGIDLNDQEASKTSNPLNELSLSELALNAYQSITTMITCFDLETFNQAFITFLCLGDKLGYTSDDIRLYYFKKNQINHQRQDTNY